eukprot:scaffold41534_cov70-Phaeocystis_antarctica.AAC.4
MTRARPGPASAVLLKTVSVRPWPIADARVCPSWPAVRRGSSKAVACRSIRSVVRLVSARAPGSSIHRVR